ncbi:inositol-tetrakisphosphate 1-kinase 1 isoform X2 [Ricinus communis]|uniref:inositol-tetrakisphosphate 1-kinase 1 isoform X2 n=1 Tax=Ricinus communis TaxID=3988 RepID=UPI000772A52A|nr:inositol-tetrakisphosphate 1-kinase 1 isoform X2 [Ricinus communis]|eukprot:XP_015575228.1 inositol-tetrakisphosphate 1-kinase 1 isoform X2 [Ricinus communis]
MSTTTEGKRHRIGYALAPKKVQSFIQPSLINHASSHNIDLIPINPSESLIEQGPFDSIIHKLYGTDWKKQLEKFSLQYPNVPIIDSPEAIERLHNRISMLEVVNRLKIPKRSEILEVPKQVVVLDSENLKENGLVGELGFPLVAKPLVADGSATSHKMYQIFDTDGLQRLDAPIILQDFVNHGGVIFKIYVAGDYVQCVKRKSLPDISREKLATLKGSLSFSQISNLNAREKSKGGQDDVVDLEKVEMPPLGFVEEIARAMREETGLSLFNFDVIRDAKVGNRRES